MTAVDKLRLVLGALLAGRRGGAPKFHAMGCLRMLRGKLAGSGVALAGRVFGSGAASGLIVEIWGAGRWEDAPRLTNVI